MGVARLHNRNVLQVAVLAITSPVKRCGKTLTLILLGAFVPRRLFAANVTPAVFHPIKSRFGAETLNGYTRRAFEDAWTRYPCLKWNSRTTPMNAGLNRHLSNWNSRRAVPVRKMRVSPMNTGLVPLFRFNAGNRDNTAMGNGRSRRRSSRGYQDVVVHRMAGNCRSNVGLWPSHESEAPRGARGFDYYARRTKQWSQRHLD